MKSKLFYRTSLCLLFIFSSHGSKANELGRSYQFFTQGLWQFDLSASYLASEANYDASGGAYENLPDVNNIVDFNSKLSTTYGLGRNWNVWGHGAFGYTETVDTENTRSNAGLSYLDAGTEYRVFSHPYLQVIPVGRLRIPLYQVDPTVDEAVYAEGSTEVEGLLLLQNKMGAVRSHVYGGYRFRSDGRSSQIPWGLGSELWLGNWAIGGSLSGEFTAAEDDYTSDPDERHDYLEEVNAGSFRYYSINPELLKLGAWGRYAFDKQLFIRAGIETTLNGQNAAVGTTFFAQVSFYLWPSRGRSSLPTETYENFRIDTDDGVDHEKLFENPREDEIENPRKKRVDLETRRKRAQERLKRQEQNQKVQQEERIRSGFDEVERELEESL